MPELFRKIGFVLRFCWFRLLFAGRLTTEGFVFFEPGVVLRIDPGARIVLKERVYLKRGCILECFKEGVMTIGSRSNIGYYTWIACSQRIDLGEKCILGHCVTLFDVPHVWSRREAVVDQGYGSGQIAFGPDVIVTSKCTVGADLSIAPGVLVGANSVVTRSLDEEYAVYGGVPARKIGERS